MELLSAKFYPKISGLVRSVWKPCCTKCFNMFIYPCKYVYMNISTGNCTFKCMFITIITSNSPKYVQKLRCVASYICG